MKDTFESLRILKSLNPRLKILISLGSHMHSLTPWRRIFLNGVIRRNFIRNTIIFLNKYNFDGIEVNWNQRTSLGLSDNVNSQLNKNKIYFTKFLQV